VPRETKGASKSSDHRNGLVVVPNYSMHRANRVEAPDDLLNLTLVTQVYALKVIDQISRHTASKLRPQHNHAAAKFPTSHEGIIRHAGLRAKDKENLALHCITRRAGPACVYTQGRRLLSKGVLYGCMVVL
jgi:hypothetical protein